VRAGLVERPEDWRGSSIFLRDIGKADWLMPLSEILAQPCEEKALIEFRERLYHRGSVPTKQGQASISQAVLDQEAARGFANRGVYRKRLHDFKTLSPSLEDPVTLGTPGFTVRLSLWRIEAHEEASHSRLLDKV
jgi:hypothetical protein